MAHSHDGHGHGHSHGGHVHSHGDSPYDRECQAPTTAAVMCFMSAFLGALSAVSLPTHITGYFLPTLPSSILLYFCVASGLVYGVLCVLAFFTVLGEATGEGYRVRWYAGGKGKGGGEGEEKEEEEEDVTKKAMGRLRWVSRGAMGVLVLYVGASIALFVFGLQDSADEWNEWCSDNSLLIVESTDTESATAAKLTTCEAMKLNQTYLVLGIPGLLILLELFRFLKTSSFISLALAVPAYESYTPLDVPDPGAPFNEGEEVEGALRESQRGVEGGREMHELARRRRRRERDERRRRRYREESGSGSEEEDEKGLLSE